MKLLCAAAVAALAFSSLGCQAMKQTTKSLDSQVLPVSHVQRSQNAPRPALRPTSFECGGCGESCGGDPCGGCGGSGCGACCGSGFCSSGNPHVNGLMSKLLDCKATHSDAYYGFQPGPPVGQTAYPYYTVRGPRDFLARNPRSIGPTGAYGCR